MRGTRIITWELLCTLLLEYLSLTEAGQQAAPLAVAIIYSQAEMAQMYIANLKPGI